MMCDDKKILFFCNWKIKNIMKVYKHDDLIKTHDFKIKSIGDCRWEMWLTIEKEDDTSTNELEISLELFDYEDKIVSESLSLCFRCELLDPDGKVFAAKEILNRTFKDCCKSCQFIMIDDFIRRMSSWSENNITVCLYVAETQENLSVVVKEKVIDCEVETVISYQASVNNWFLSLTDQENWSTVRKVGCLTIPIEISIWFTGFDILFEIWGISKDDCEYLIGTEITINGGTFETTITVYDENEWTNSIVFDKLHGWWRLQHRISKETLDEAECFANKEIKLECGICIFSCSKITYPKEKKLKKTTQVVPPNADNVSCLQQDLSSLLMNKYFTDIHLKADDEVFPAHKGILAARSPVFSAMFQQDMLESKTGFVDVLDVTANSLKSFLEFIYTGEIKKIDEDTAFDMIIMADKYQITSLEKMSSTFLMSVLSSNNALKILSIADMVKCECLKSSAVDYILVNSKEILSTSDWLQWAPTNIALATEIILKLSK